MRKNKIIYLAESAEGAYFRYRVKNVAEAVRRGKWWEVKGFLRTDVAAAERELPGAKLVVIARQTAKDRVVLDFMKKARMEGVRVLFDVDDLVFDLRDLPVVMRGTGSRNAAYWAGYIWGVRRIARKVDGFLTTNEFLAKKLRRSFGKPVRVIRNSLNREQVEVSKKLVVGGGAKSRKGAGFTVGYFSGSPTHGRDFRMVEPELVRFLSKHEDVRLKVVGKMRLSRRMRELVGAGRVEVVGMVDYLELQRLMSEVEVNIAPLVVNDFTNCKSELKWFEAAAVETVTVASPSYTFKQAIKGGVNGFLAQPGEWFDKLEYLYQHPAERQRIAKRARRDALENYYNEGEQFLREVEGAFDYFASEKPQRTKRSEFQESIQLPDRKVSVIVPNYNYKQYLEKRMRSILAQTYSIYEIIILDDASMDGSEEWLKGKVSEWQQEYPRVKFRLVINRQNSGKTLKQWQKGLKMAKGDFIWIAEADDLCSRKFLAEVMPSFADQKVVIAYAESRIISGRGLMIAPNFRWSRDRERTGHFQRSYVKDGREEVEEIMAIRCTIPNVSAVVWRKEALKEKYLMAATKWQQVGDWYLYAQVLTQGKISYIHAALNYYRVHQASVTGQARGSRSHYEEVLKMHKWFLQEYKIPAEVRERMRGEEERLRRRLEG